MLACLGTACACGTPVEERMRVPVTVAKSDGAEVARDIAVALFRDDGAPRPYPGRR